MSVKDGDGRNLPALRLFITDTLGDPYATQTQFSALTQPIGESRRQANEIKRREKITVVIGNPPYKEKAKGRGGWIESGSDTNKELPAPLARWSPPTEWGASAHAKHLKNLYVYFWRWATLKVFGSGWYAATGEPDEERAGIVCFITVAGFLNGPGLQKMRDDLRRDCSDIWVIDCSPEGHQPDVPTRIFQGVQQPVCIVLAVRPAGKDRTTPARVHFRALPEGKREAKFNALAGVMLACECWADGPNGWRDPFLPEAGGSWSAFAALHDLFEYNGSGVMPGRTWVIASDAGSLSDRWNTLINEKDPSRKELLFHPHESGDRTSTKGTRKGLSGHEARSESVAGDRKPVVKPARYAFRTLDRQWIIPDTRLLNRPNITVAFSDGLALLRLGALVAITTM
ncbi:type ISP restriction/modification enzyme [Methylosinus sp. RM1]|uniref:type ISP restriction/modification enzyme n=1 Tax=Methylosinus sp. RM1 TaxID=2583817 RepID=UPI001A9C9BD9|nr:type ISP restriction/modification enzyme [Methylosinus sp. RM1]